MQLLTDNIGLIAQRKTDIAQGKWFIITENYFNSSTYKEKELKAGRGVSNTFCQMF